MKESFEQITSARQLQLVLDLQHLSGPNSIKAVETFRHFLSSLAQHSGANENGESRGWQILKDYLQSQLPPDESDETSNYMSTLFRGWDSASQSNNNELLELIPTTLALLLHLLSHKIDYREYGLRLCRDLLRPSKLKLLARGLAAAKHKPGQIASCLRLLLEVVLFDGGAVAKKLYSAREMTLKGLARNMGLRDPSHMIVDGDGNRMPVRHVAVRFLLAYLKYQDTAARRELFGNRDIMSAIFRNIKNDTPDIISEILVSLKEILLSDDKLEARSKTRLLSDWNLSRISMLYDYKPPPGVDSDQTTRIDVQAHGFLMFVCTTPDLGVLFPQSGWYPTPPPKQDEQSMVDGVDEEALDLIPIEEESLDFFAMFCEGVPVRNTTLAAFIQTLQPYASVAQSDLLLGIFKAAPELVAEYSFRRRNYNFDPKSTPAWMGFAAFLYSTVQLPVPAFCGRRDGFDPQPPAVCIVIENILPQPLTQKILMRCLHHSEDVVTFFALRLLIVAFQKLENVRAVFQTAVAQGFTRYREASSKLVWEFCRRCPSMRDVITVYRGIPDSEPSQREAAAKLLTLYYKIIPSVAYDEKLDVSIPLLAVLSRITTPEQHEIVPKLQLLELEHLLHIATASPNMQWWHKSVDLEYSPYTLLLKMLCDPAPILPIALIRGVLESVAADSQLFQTDTSLSSFDALLSSLQESAKHGGLDAILAFLDRATSRYVLKALFYQAQLETLVGENSRHSSDSHMVDAGEKTDKVKSTSPILLVLVEQWPFTAGSTKISDEDKGAIAGWISRYLGYSYQIGECGKTLEKLRMILRKETESKAVRKHLVRSLDDVLPLMPAADRRPALIPAVENPLPIAAQSKTATTVDLETDLDVEMPDAPNPNALFVWTRKEVQDIFEDGNAGQLVVCLCSEDIGIRRQALTGLMKLVVKIQGSTYAESDTMTLLLQEVIHTAKSRIGDAPFPTFLGSFARQAISVQMNPQHFLYGKLNAFLQKGPTWDLQALPMLRQLLLAPPEDDNARYAEIEWLLNVLIGGLRTAEDIDVYRRQNVFERLLSLHSTPHLPVSHRKLIIRLVCLALTIEGGSTMLVSRVGLLSWLRGQQGQNDCIGDEAIHQLVRRLWKTCDQERIKAWSGGLEQTHVVDYIL